MAQRRGVGGWTQVPTRSLPAALAMSPLILNIKKETLSIWSFVCYPHGLYGITWRSETRGSKETEEGNFPEDASSLLVESQEKRIMEPNHWQQAYTQSARWLVVLRITIIISSKQICVFDHLWRNMHLSRQDLSLTNLSQISNLPSYIIRKFRTLVEYKNVDKNWMFAFRSPCDWH